jgi:multidrug efflux system outer membrane protein
MNLPLRLLAPAIIKQIIMRNKPLNRLNTIIMVGTSMILVLFLSGCAVHKDMERVKPDSVVPDSFSQQGQAEMPDRWWRVFQDSDLDSVIDSALQNNLNLRLAWSRLDQLKAVLRITDSAIYPQVNGAIAAQRTRNGEASFFQPDKTVDAFSISSTAAYQVDLWKKIDSSRQAELLGFQATRKDIEATSMTIVSAVAEIWYSLAEQEAVLLLLQEQLKVNQDFLDLVELRFSQGAASAVDVYQQRLQLEGTRNQIPQVETTIKVLKHQLALLLGKNPTDEVLMPGKRLPSLPELPRMGIPLEIVRKRPDVRSAELRIYSADKKIAVAIADRFPSLSISTGAGAQASDLSDLIDNWFVNLAGNLLGPIFDGGRRQAEVDRTKAVLKEKVIAWKQSILTALKEVEDTLVQESGQNKVLAGVKGQIALAEQTLTQAKSRYVNGLSSYLNVLTSLQALQNLERSEISLRKQLISNRIKLYVALGGTWTEELQQPGESSVEEFGEIR